MSRAWVTSWTDEEVENFSDEEFDNWLAMAIAAYNMDGPIPQLQVYVDRLRRRSLPVEGGLLEVDGEVWRMD